MPPPFPQVNSRMQQMGASDTFSKQHLQMNVPVNAATDQRSQVSSFLNQFVQPVMGSSSGSSFASFQSPTVACSDSAFKSSLNCQNVGIQASNVISSSVVVPSPALNFGFQSSVNARFVPPPTHLPPPVHMPPPPMPFNLQLPPPSFSSLIPPPMPPPALPSVVPAQPPPTSSASRFTMPPFNFNVPPPGAVNASIVPQATHGPSVQNEQVRLPVLSSGQAVGTVVPQWPIGCVPVRSGTAVSCAPAVQNQLAGSYASSHQGSVGFRFVQNENLTDQNSATDAQLGPTLIPHSSAKPTFSADVSEQNPDVKWMNSFVSSVRQRSSGQISDTKRNLTIPQFRSYLKEVIMLNEQLKVYRSPGGVESTNNKENVNVEKNSLNNVNGLSEHANEQGRAQIGSDLEDLQVAQPACYPVACQESMLNGSLKIAGDDADNYIKLQWRIEELKHTLNESCDGIKKKLKRIADKRKHIKRRRKEMYEAEQEALAKRTKLLEDIEKWESEEQLKQSAAKMEEEMKKAADKTLLEVRRKISDAHQSLKLLTQLRKLRQLRKDQAERKGIPVRKSADDIFEERVDALSAMMKQQLELYEAERRALQVMLETEQEETKERERVKREKREEEQLKKYEQQLNEYLFGLTESISADHPMAPFRQYYDLANYSVDALINIRKEWDMYLVPEGTPGGSGVPYCWVTPQEPTNDIWASALSK